MKQRRLLVLTAFCLLPAAFCLAQSSNATLMGNLTSQGDGKPLRGAMVIYRNQRTNSAGYVRTNSQGFYILEALPPGRYEVGAGAQGCRPALRPDVELAVASRVEINFSMEALPSFPPAASPTLPAPGPRAKTTSSGFLDAVYGPDAQQPQPVLIDLPTPLTETLVGQISTVIDEPKILELPYSGRDVYTLLVLQPGVSSSNAIPRGLGFAVNGQRVSGTNFLLDGVDNNDLLLTGPSAKVSADAVQEYRMVTNNFSADFGRATAFIANAITRTGTNKLHGGVFEFFNHDRLNANSFLNNASGLPRLPYRYNQYGGTLGGPVRRDRAFFFGSFEQSYSSSQSFDSTIYVLGRSFISSLPDGSIAKNVLTQFAPPQGRPTLLSYVEQLSSHYPLLQRNTMFLGRADYGAPGERNSFRTRYAFSQSTAEDFLHSIYKGFNAPLVAPSQNLAFNYTSRLFSAAVNELKLGLNLSRVGFNRPHPDFPALFALDQVLFRFVSLPGSEAAYAYSVRDRVLHVVDNFSVLRGKHGLVTGVEWHQNRDRSETSIGRDGAYTFSTLSFLLDRPFTLGISVDRFTGKALDPSAYQREYSQEEFAAFFQDNWKLAHGVTLNLGLRYEYFGVPERQDGPPDWNIFYGPGNNRVERLAAAGFRRAAPYSPDGNNFAPRFGFAWDLTGRGKTVLRGGYGISFDRIFNNIWLDVRNNSLAFLNFTSQFSSDAFKYMFPARDALPPTTSVDLNHQLSVQVDETLRSPYAQSWFVGLQQEITPNLVVEVDQAGSLGRKLIIADEINRPYTNPADEDNLFGFINPKLGNISYRGNQGSSNYVSLQASARQRLSRGVQFQVSYTYSRARDNQSDPFLNSLNSSPNYSVPAANSVVQPRLIGFADSSFTRQFDSSLDRGLSDFDQNHNLVFNILAQSPNRWWASWLTGGWQLAAMTGFRGGFPFTVRADLVGGSRQSAFLSPARPGPGGLYLLDRTKFEIPAEGQVGNLPRNAFHGPGFWNADMGLSRSFALPRFGEQARLQFRAEFFNLFNHANLGNPDSQLLSPTFGLARFGPQGFGGSLPIVSPLSEQPRRVQVGLKFYF